MAPVNSNDQFNFLISCIRNSNNGKVDFVKVAGECEIVSKGAAAKRYERMMKAHGINAGGGSATSSPSKKTAGSKRKPTTDAAGAHGDADDDGNASDAKGGVPAKRGRNIKDKVVERAEKLVLAQNPVKDEDGDDEQLFYVDEEPVTEEAEVD